MAKTKRKRQDFTVRAVAKIDGEPNQGGRALGSVNKTMPDYKRFKQGLVELFNTSRAPAVIMQMLSMTLPPMLKPHNSDKLTPAEDARFRAMLLSNFKWAVDAVIKCVPKELGVFGKIQQEHTLAGLVQRASRSPKSPAVVDMVKHRRDGEMEDYVAEVMEDA